MMRVVLFAVLVSLAFGATSRNRPTFKLKIGVYSPRGLNWEGAVDEEWSMSSQEFLSKQLFRPIAVDFIYFREEYEMVKSSIDRASEAMKTSDVSALIGPYSEPLVVAANDLSVPYVVVSRHDVPKSESLTLGSVVVNLLPNEGSLQDAVRDFMTIFEWKEMVAIIYDDVTGLHLLGALMEVPDIQLRAWRLDIDSSSNAIRDQLLAIRQLSIKQIIVHCDPKLSEEILSTALKLSMLSRYYNWLMLSLDPVLIDYDPYKYTMVNLTMFQVYQPMNDTKVSLGRHNLQRALAHDSILFLTTAMSLYVDALDNDNIECPPFCGMEHIVEGSKLLNFIPDVSIRGSTGIVEFNTSNYRTNTSFSVLSLMENGVEQIGIWNDGFAGKRMKISKWSPDEKTDNSRALLGQGTVKIVTILDQPFVMRRTDCDSDTTDRPCIGNDRFEGYLIDLIEKIAEKMGFQYELYESPDGKYGSKEDDGEWNGMIRELIVGNASMCLGAISITSEREEVIDFAKPYKQKMFNLLVKKPKEKSSIFQFLWPLSPIVWILITSSLAIVGLLLFIMDRLSPNSQDVNIGRFTVSESLWFIYGSLVGAGTEMVPRTLSGRLLTGSWWFFALILVSSYTANLAAFLTVTKIETPIKSVADLAAQTKIKYGTVKNTYSSSMFKNSKMEIFQKMWGFMTSITDSMVDNTSVGLEKVKAGDYAFIWDAPINKYITLTDCDTMIVGDPFDEKGYGIGVPLGAAYRDDITMAILSLSEDGVMQNLESKWWSGGECGEFRETSTQTKELNIHNVGGVFLVLACGSALAALVACMEFLWRTGKPRNKKERGLDGEALPPKDLYQGHPPFRSSVYRRNTLRQKKRESHF